ncbi:MAG: D-alanyl-D-alanine carboxypeptidase [Labilithrix sp.]|nr:D-alanyl-D-alanine carboxypeptidase [Labilithrix sp.]
MNKLARRVISGLLVLAVVFGVLTEAQAASVCYSLPFSNPNLADGWGSLKGGRTNPHRGVDFPQAAGTPIPAVAAGTVALVTYTSCLGNVVVLKHADGMYSGYAHMLVKSSLTAGTKVAMGQTLGKVGTTGSCTTGNHLHLVMGPTLNSYAYGTTVDPYKYIQAHKTCSCHRSAGGFTFSCDGPVAGEHCVNVKEPADSDSWADNYVCSKTDHGLAWSSAGPLAGKRCTNIKEPTGSDGAKWADNYLCVDVNATVRLSWTYDGSTSGKTCFNWNETVDPDSWNDNYLCVAPNYDYKGGIFTFKSNGTVAGQTCVNVNEPADKNSWSDNNLCTASDIGLRWSSAGPIPGMRCTNVSEAAEHVPAAWADNYLCVPNDSPYNLDWSNSGKIPGKTCVPWRESADLDGSWGDNFLCYTTTGVAGPVPDEGEVDDGTPETGDGQLDDPSSDEDAAADLNGVDTMDSAEHAEEEAAGCSTSRTGGASTSLLAVAVGTLVASIVRRRRRR